MSEKKTAPVDLLVAAKSLCNKLRRIHNDPLYQSVWLMASNHGIDYSNGIKYIDELEQLEKMIAAATPAEAPLNKQISLPKITEEILDQFEGEEFIERDLETRSPRWTQEAVDFVCLLSQQATEASQDELARMKKDLTGAIIALITVTGSGEIEQLRKMGDMLKTYAEMDEDAAVSLFAVRMLIGLLERHSTDPNLVRVKEEGWSHTSENLYQFLGMQP